MLFFQTQSPCLFNGKSVFTFSLDKEVDLVGENGAKSNGGATVAAIQMIPVKEQSEITPRSYLVEFLISVKSRDTII